eukprot:4762199-Prymnesium_polylepis.1
MAMTRQGSCARGERLRLRAGGPAHQRELGGSLNNRVGNSGKTLKSQAGSSAHALCVPLRSMVHAPCPCATAARCIMASQTPRVALQID